MPLKGTSQSTTGSKAEDKSSSGTLGNQVVQVATNRLGKVLGGHFNSGGGSGTTTTSQTSGTDSLDEDVNQILEDTFGGSQDTSNTDTSTTDEDVNQILDDTFGNPDDTSETPTTTDDDVNQILDDTFGAEDGDETTATMTTHFARSIGNKTHLLLMTTLIKF